MTDQTEIISKKTPIPTPEEENIQQALSLIWALKERDCATSDKVGAALDDAIAPGMLGMLESRNLLSIEGSPPLAAPTTRSFGGRWPARGGTPAELGGTAGPPEAGTPASQIKLTPEGAKIARDIVRRHRLAERLFEDVLAMPRDQIDPNACRLEHVIGEDVEEAICTLLGHPEICPHGLSVPRGRCCEKALGQTGPIVMPLAALALGQEGKIVYLSLQNRPELHRLLSMGLAPGNEIRVTQTYPAIVLAVGETMLAIEPSLANSIFIRRKNGKK